MARRKKSEGKIRHTRTTIDGITFDSKLEAQYYEYLKAEKKAGRVKDFVLQPEFVLQPAFFIWEGQAITSDHPEYKEYNKKRLAFNRKQTDDSLKIKPIRSMIYKSDFTITYSNGEVITVDTKGLKTADFKLKEKMMKFLYPNINLICINYDKVTGEWLEYSAWQKLVKERKAERALKAKKKTNNKTKTKKKEK